jgi:hypothetical protein
MPGRMKEHHASGKKHRRLPRLPQCPMNGMNHVLGFGQTRTGYNITISPVYQLGEDEHSKCTDFGRWVVKKHPDMKSELESRFS